MNRFSSGPKVAIAALLFVTGSGCTTLRPVRMLILPNGHSGAALYCDGSARRWTDCLSQAGPACGGPYKIISQNGEAVDASMFAGGVYMPLKGVHREMVVECTGTK
jgi:hypothetical protein